MAATSPVPEDRTNKRLKQEDGPASSPQPVPPPQPQQRYPPAAPHYGGGPPPPAHLPPAGYYGGPPGQPPPQYGNHPPPPPPPPHHWQGGPPPPGPAGRYPPGPLPPPQRGHSPSRMGGHSPWQGGLYSDSSPSKGRKPKLTVNDGDDPYYMQGHLPHPPYQGPPPSGYGPPPSHWQGGPPPPMYASQGTWTGKTPPRDRHHDPYRHEMDMPSYMSRGQQSVDDDGGSSAGGSAKDKGRGSYKCGRCGVPKKGHVCPYQPKLKRRPDEPPPQTRSAAVQVEMDEFMTLRRLNIKIQGFPESYASEPYMSESMVVGEILQHPIIPPMPPEMTSHMHPVEMTISMAVAEPTESRDAGVGEGSLEDADVPI